MIGVYGAPLVTAEDKVSLKIFITTKPGSLVTVSLSSPAGTAKNFPMAPGATPPTFCKL